MVHLWKGWFPTGTYNKLKNRKLGLFPVLQAYRANAYRLELPSDLHINFVFNVVDLCLYRAHDDFQLATWNSRIVLF